MCSGCGGARVRKATSTCSFWMSACSAACSIYEEGAAHLERAGMDPLPDYLIGVFKHADGRRAVMLNNYHFAYTAWPRVEFDVPASQIREVDQKTGREVPVYDDSPNMEGLQISLDAGAGRLFLMP